MTNSTPTRRTLLAAATTALSMLGWYGLHMRQFPGERIWAGGLEDLVYVSLLVVIPTLVVAGVMAWWTRRPRPVGSLGLGLGAMGLTVVTAAMVFSAVGAARSPGATALEFVGVAIFSLLMLLGEAWWIWALAAAVIVGADKALGRIDG